jgi:hypothetical protein
MASMAQELCEPGYTLLLLTPSVQFHCQIVQ